MSNDLLQKRQAVLVFIAFSAAYFISTFIRAVTATLSPLLSTQLQLQAQDLGLLAGGFALGFAIVQLPMGEWLDRYGPRRTSTVLLVIAVLGCAGFASAHSFYGLLLARLMTGVGLSGCLMAPLAGNRRWLTAPAQLRANSWMLMAGSLGMLTSTLPVQWFVQAFGWRVIFGGLGALLLGCIATIIVCVPKWHDRRSEQTPSMHGAHWLEGYSEVLSSPAFYKAVPIGFFGYGSLLAVQTLWAAPWMREIGHYSDEECMLSLFVINLAMMFCFGVWGWVMPRLQRRAISVDKLVKMLYPLCIVSLGATILINPSYSAAALLAYCLTSSVIAMVQPTVGLSFENHLAGKALCAYNFVIFIGIFAVQWSLGLIIDASQWGGLSKETGYKSAFFIDLCCTLVAYLYFCTAKGDNANKLKRSG